MNQKEFDSLLDRLENNELTEIDRINLREVLVAFVWMGDRLEHSELSIQRLKRLFGIKTEKANNLFGKSNDDKNVDRNKKPEAQSKKKGHKGAIDYPGAEKVFVAHESLKSGQKCPVCNLGTLFSYGVGSVVKLFGHAPISAVVYNPEQLRCSACQNVFTAKLPDEVGSDHADPTAKAIVATLRYGSGLPFYRNEKLQEMLQVPVPDSTQWDMAEELVNDVYPAYEALLKTSAGGELFYSDDTGMRVVRLKKQLQAQGADRTGIFTTGIVSEVEGHEAALFFTGNRHAGENMAVVLRKRESDLSPPMMMCDALSRNKPKDLEMEIEQGSCLDHARRQFVDIATRYEEEAKYFINELKVVYKNDRDTRSMTKEERLKYHQAQSLPVMEKLMQWCMSNLENKVVEPNSPLGGAMKYYLKHYERLTMFCKIAGMPISSSEVERLLKTSVLHRKNSLFYQTVMGALVGDVLMSLIQTARRAHVNVFDYLTQMQIFKRDVKEQPEDWLPWSYLDRVSELRHAH